MIQHFKGIKFKRAEDVDQYNLQQKTQVLLGFPNSYKSAVDPYRKPSSKGVQNYECLPNGRIVSLPVVHFSAKFQVIDEAEYADDTPMSSNRLQVGYEELPATLCIRDELYV